MEQETKVCKKCAAEKPITDFWLSDREKGYVRSTCKDCDKAYQRLQYARSEEFRAKSKANSLKWQKLNVTYANGGWVRQLKYKYGITVADYEAMVVAQDGKCALCGASDPGRTGLTGKWKAGRWNVDHCHETGRNRGLLCHKCNVRVGAYEGLLKDVGIHKVVAYLTGPPHEPPIKK